MNSPTRVAICCAVLVACCATERECSADSAVSLLSGFDRERIEAVYPPQDDNSAGELAKLIFRLRTVDANALEARVGDASGKKLGDAVRIEGEIQEIKFVKVPDRLVEFVELSRLHVVAVGTDASHIRVVTTTLPREAKRGDRVSGVGVVIELDVSNDEANIRLPVAIASARLRWFPESTERIGWQLLSEAGLDVSLLADVGTRNRRRLLAEDGDAFYSMLAAAATVAKRDDMPTPSLAEPVALLEKPEGLSGQWLRMNLETVQVTRVAVTEPHRQTQLGSDHYFQIDAVGDLGDIVVEIKRAEGDNGPPATFENRYPVSVVVRELPEFLKQRIRSQEGGDAVLSQFKVMVGVDAFFFRLWSYSTDFMNQYGGQDQFGPLLIAARIDDQEPTSSDPAGVGIIGSFAALAVISAIFATWLWSRRVAARDLEVRQRRNARESEQLELP